MKRLKITAISLVVVLVLASGCVWQSEYDDFVEKMEYQNEILACEGRVDVYEGRLGSDEPSGTRRDEPLGTRRD